MDPYTLLGLDPPADAQAVKRAFRRLAMRWHPDRNPDPAALEHFKILRAAHDYLLLMLESAGDAAPADYDDAASHTRTETDTDTDTDTETEDSKNTQEAEPSTPRGADRTQDLVLSLEEAFFGCEREVTVDALSSCEVCDASGRETMPFSQLCGNCHGSGRVRSSAGLVKCASCAGQGYARTQSCRHCGGTGAVNTPRTLSVKIPPGLLNGDWLRIAGEGEPADDPRGRPGDLKLRLHLAPHLLFALEGRNLVIERPVSAFRMLLGGEIKVPVPGGIQTLAIEPGEPDLREIHLAHAGFPGRRGEPDGDLLVRLQPVFPSFTDARLHKLLVSLERILASDPAQHLSAVDQWEARWLGRAPER